MQIIEALEYRPNSTRTVKLLFIVVVVNGTSKPLRFRIVHRRRVTGTLRHLTFPTPSENSEWWDTHEGILRKLYRNRIRIARDGETADFFPRVNCTTYSRVPFPVSLAGPGACFKASEPEIPLKPLPELPDKVMARAFTSFLVPPEKFDPISPGESSIFTVDMSIGRDAYEKLVKDTFTVDSYGGVKRDIETYDLPEAVKVERDYYEQFVRPMTAIIAPEAYDIVIVQNPDHQVEVAYGTVDVTQVKPARDPDLANRVIWLLGHRSPAQFRVVLQYARARVRMPEVVQIPIEY